MSMYGTGRHLKYRDFIWVFVVQTGGATADLGCIDHLNIGDCLDISSIFTQ